MALGKEGDGDPHVIDRPATRADVERQSLHKAGIQLDIGHAGDGEQFGGLLGCGERLGLGAAVGRCLRTKGVQLRAELGEVVAHTARLRSNSR